MKNIELENARRVFEKEFGQLVRAKRNEMRYTQEDLAEVLGIRQTEVSRIECGDDGRHVYLFNAVKICQELNIDMGEVKQLHGNK